VDRGCSEDHTVSCPVNKSPATPRYITYANGKMALSYMTKHYIPGLGCDSGNFSHHHNQGVEKLGPFSFLRSSHWHADATRKRPSAPQSPLGRPSGGGISATGKARSSAPRRSKATGAPRLLAARLSSQLSYRSIQTMLDTLSLPTDSDLNDPTRYRLFLSWIVLVIALLTCPLL
jgi:hypothetical protein